MIELESRELLGVWLRGRMNGMEKKIIVVLFCAPYYIVVGPFE
jgi:hypothetical protein